MCGIAGVIDLSGKQSPDALRAIARRMAEVMPHRGPDDWGAWVDPTGYCAFAHRRLSIIDTSSGGHQPMLSEDGHFALTFNGEIYNHLDIRHELIQRGSVFRSHSDTEVLLDSLSRFGPNILSYLDGMFAFGFFNSETREVLLARDPFGEKPLYYTTCCGLFAFASELHALEVLPGFSRTVSRDAIAEFLVFQYVPPPRTIYENVSKLPPASFLALSPDGSVKIGEYFKFEPQADPNPHQPIDALADELEELLSQSIQRRMISDVPLGAFLSGGVDSSAVVALMSRKLGQHVQSFSLGTPGSDESEHHYAREMAQHLGTEHHELLVTPNVAELATTVAHVLDEPNGDASCMPVYLLSEFSRKRVTVLLSGDGGDELFGGYSRYFSTIHEIESAGSDRSAGEAYFSDRILVYTEPQLEAVMGEIPAGARESFQAFRNAVDSGTGPLLSRLRRLDLTHYMPGAVLSKVDRMSMQHSLEVRCPFLNIDIARFAEKLAPQQCYRDRQGKVVLKEVASRYIPRAWLERQKSGFSVPIHLWNRIDFVKSLRHLIQSEQAQITRYLDKQSLLAFLDQQERASGYSAYQVWSLFILERWLQRHTTPGYLEIASDAPSGVALQEAA